jgi:hypothetical protein
MFVRRRPHSWIANRFVPTALALLGVALGQPVSPAAEAAGGWTPATATFSSVDCRILGDGPAPYACWIDNSGSLWMRTAKDDPGRSLSLDFGSSGAVRSPSFTCGVPESDEDPADQSYELDTCASNLISDVKIDAPNLFKQETGCTRVRFEFSMYPDFRGLGDFLLEFDCVPFSGSGDLRILTAASGTVGHLYRNTCLNPPRGTRWSKDWIADIPMPFQLTVIRSGQ